MVEERLAQLQASRDRIQAKELTQREEFASVLEKTERERKEYENWMNEEKKLRVEIEAKARSLQVMSGEDMMELAERLIHS